MSSLGSRKQRFSYGWVDVADWWGAGWQALAVDRIFADAAGHVVRLGVDFFA